jgi:hypothetical protein
MKAARFIPVIGLLVAVVSSLLVFTKVRHEQGGQNGAAQVLTKRNVVVAQASKENDGNAPGTLDSHPDRPLSDEAVAFANPASNIGISPSKDLPVSSVSEGKPSLPVGQRADNLSASEDKPDLSVSQMHQSSAPVDATDETKSDSVESNPAGIDISWSFLNNPEVYGQNGELLPSPEKVLASKAKSILENYKDRNAEGVIISEELVGENQSGPSDTESSVEVVTSVETVEMLAEQSTSDTDNPSDTKSRTDRLLAALADSNPVDVRLQAIYLLADVAPDQTKKFLNDKEDVIRCEAERIAGILPQDW